MDGNGKWFLKQFFRRNTRWLWPYRMLPRAVLLERGAHADRWHHRHAVPLLRILPNVDRFGGEALRLAEEAIAAALEIGKKANENDIINFKLSVLLLVCGFHQLINRYAKKRKKTRVLIDVNGVLCIRGFVFSSR